MSKINLNLEAIEIEVNNEDAFKIIEISGKSKMTCDRYGLETVQILKDIKRRIALLVEKESHLKKELTEKYFSRCEILIDLRGKEICTGFLQQRITLDQKAIEKELPLVFEKYKRESAFFHTILPKI